MNKRTRTSQATSSTSKSNSDTDQPHWSKSSSSKEGYIEIRKCRERSRVYIINEEVKRWISSPKQQEAPPESSKTKEEVRLEEMKKGRKISSRMGWFFSSGRVEILNVRRPFMTW